MPAINRVLCVLLVMACGCETTEPPVDQPDALPVLQYENFAATTWSIAMVEGRYQLSITDGTGTPACALSQDHGNDLGAAGHQLILSLPDTSGVPCPNGMYPMNTSCGTNLGDGASVPASCAYYRAWNEQGALLGVAGAINGEITVGGSTGSCTIRVNVGFLGGSFAMMATLTDGAGAQPWCTE